jgi:hypothetical protein
VQRREKLPGWGFRLLRTLAIWHRRIRTRRTSGSGSELTFSRRRRVAGGFDHGSIWYGAHFRRRHLAVNIGVRRSAADSGAIRSARVPKLNESPGFVAFWYSRARVFGPQSGALQAPADHGGLQLAAGFMIAPAAVNEAAGERQLVCAATVLAKYLDQQFR